MSLFSPELSEMVDVMFLKEDTVVRGTTHCSLWEIMRSNWVMVECGRRSQSAFIGRSGVLWMGFFPVPTRATPPITREGVQRKDPGVYQLFRGFVRYAETY